MPNYHYRRYIKKYYRKMSAKQTQPLPIKEDFYRPNPFSKPIQFCVNKE